MSGDINWLLARVRSVIIYELNRLTIYSTTGESKHLQDM